MRGGRILIALTVIAGGLFAAFVVWALVREPILSAIYGDVPPFIVATDLQAPISFPARVLDKRRWSLRLLVYYDNGDERDAVKKLVGPYRAPEKIGGDFGVTTEFQIIVRDATGRTVRDERRTGSGMFSEGMNYITRTIDEFVLSPGIYSVQVTPVGDFSQFRRFRTGLGMGTHPKAGPIRD